MEEGSLEKYQGVNFDDFLKTYLPIDRPDNPFEIEETINFLRLFCKRKTFFSVKEKETINKISVSETTDLNNLKAKNTFLGQIPKTPIINYSLFFGIIFPGQFKNLF